MQNLLTILCNRRSVRTYTGEAVSEEKLEKVLQAGLLSPSGRGINPWEFIVIRDKETLLKMSACRNGSAKMLAGADCAVVVLGDSDRSDTIVEDCSIAMTNMQLMADSLGLGCCWIQGRLREASDGRTTEAYLREFLGFPEHCRLEAILSVGIPAKKPEPHAVPEVQCSKIHWEKF